MVRTHCRSRYNALKLLSLIGLLAVCGRAQAQWQPVDTAVIEQSPRVYVRGSGYYTDNQIQTSDEQAGPWRLVVTQSSHTVLNADGEDENGRPYFSVPTLADTVRIYFNNSRATFAYQTALYQFVEDNGQPDPSIGQVSFNNASVHDPSVIRLDDGTFYVFGSHLAAAKTNDLLNWQVVTTDGVNDDNPLFDTYAEEAAEGIAWSGGWQGSWAADVIQLADGKYHFYYNHCASPENGECDSSRSYLGVAVSAHIEGPYENIALFLKSGHRGEENPGIDGNPYNGNLHPNAIDPDVFFDKEGRLWMVYGSYSGGIWIMQMDPTSGLPLPGQGYGTKIMGGYYSAIEGPFMLYSPVSDYYYLFTSFGGFAQNDGYNMRIARSRSPQGPFVDAEGLDMIGASGNWSSIAPYGVKLMGGHLFDANPGDAGTDHGYMAPGHNSAYYDVESGKHFVIFHTRFPNRGEGHEIRVHELFINKDGWLVASPHRYAPIEGENIVDAQDLLGTYQFISHGKDINRTPHRSVYLNLKAGGVIDGDISGSYVLGDTNQITLNLDGLGSFEGVLAWQFNDNIGQLVPTFSALSAEGVSVWGTKMPAQSTEAALGSIADSLQLVGETSTDLSLATLGTQGASIQWQSSQPDVIGTDGRVVRPYAGSADMLVTLTATIKLNGQMVTKAFDVLVKARKPFNRTAQYRFEQNLDEALGYLPPGTITGNRLNTSDGIVQYASGAFGDALWLDGSSGVRLPDGLIDSYAYTVSMWLNPTALSQFSTAFFAARSMDNWLSLVPWSWDDNTMLWSGSQAWYDASAGEQLPADTWTHLAFTVNQGLVRLFLNGEQKYSGTNFADLFTGQNGVFALGVNYWDLPFNGLIDELNIYEGALSAAEIKALDIDRLSTAELLQSAADLLSLGDISAVREDLSLPTSGAYAAAISWASSDESVIATDGTVNRPAHSDVQITLTATISLDGQQSSRAFVATVRSTAPPTPLAHYSFDDSDLSDASGNVASGSVTGSRLDQVGGNLSYPAGVVGNGLLLNGSSGVRLADNLISDNSYSVSLWLNPSALTNFTSAFFGYASLDSWVSLVPKGHAGVGENTMLWSGTAWYDAGIGEQIPLNSWSHLSFVVNHGSLVIYLNGEAVFSGTDFPNVFGSASTKGFGLGVNFWDLPYQGLMDEVRIYSEAISAEDVMQLYLTEQP
ncbi:LamG-like jellyroll fold domain-containing protein [Bowmanella denitrificans]|uniref:LamG-like jellyroll fold domain-containing protein n=1 Tax=Bowmanella denitrificans TaxID=366582 RepID=UPI000C9BB506|nr:LamG-like jellyroll fold domain-containing protein [Bowmanella denitrificans]